MFHPILRKEERNLRSAPGRSGNSVESGRNWYFIMEAKKDITARQLVLVSVYRRRRKRGGGVGHEEGEGTGTRTESEDTLVRHI